MRRFYAAAEAVPEGGMLAIRLDGRPVKTPARLALAVPGGALAEAIVGEWLAQGETIEPATMPFTGLANATIDRVLPALGDFRGQIAAYGASDLLCYRAEGPAEFVERQAAAWDPLLHWARARHGIDFTLASGLMPVDQPARTLAALRGAVEALDPWLLAGLSRIVSIGGSLVGALALLEGAVEPDALWGVLTLDETWQAEHWGADEEAGIQLAARHGDYAVAARYCALVADGAGR